MMAGNTALSEATREVQVSDHLLTVTYPMAKDPKLLMSVLDHGKRAIETAATALVEHELGNGYVPPVRVTGPHEAVDAVGDLVRTNRVRIAGAQDAARLYGDLRLTMQRYREAPTVFARGEKYVIAADEYAYLREITPDELRRALKTIKEFVHGTNVHILMGGAA